MKLPKLKYVRFVPSKGVTYAYFNTGRKVAGNLVYTSLPPFGTTGFYDSYAAMLGGRGKRAGGVHRVSDLVDAYQRSLDFSRLSAGSQKTYGYTLARITDKLGDFPIQKLTRAEVREVMNNRMEGNGARNIFLSVVGVLYKWARDNDLADSHARPTEGLKSFPVGEHQPWPETLLEAALIADHPRVRLAAHLLYYTGQRIGDVVKMRWSDIRHGALVLAQQKTGKELHIPVHGALQAELARAKKQGITIITGQNGRPLKLATLRVELQAFASDLGHDIVPHGLRKNAVNSLLEAGCTVYEVMAITGQSARIVDHYAKKVSQRRLGEAAILKMERNANLQTKLQIGQKAH